MNGVHDMGGMDGFGKVAATPSEPPFHEVWEGRVLALNRVMQSTGEWNLGLPRLSRRSGRRGDNASGVALHGDLREPRALGA
jgi:hypothetical protein